MRAYQQDDVFRSMHVLDAALSPDGRFAVCQVCDTVPGKTKDEDKQANSLWRVDLAGGEPRRLTPKSGNASSPVITPDGKSLLFISARDPEGKTAHIHRLPLEGGEAEAVTTQEQGVSSFSLSPDGKWIAFTALEKAPGAPDPNRHVRISRLTYRLDTVPGYLQDVPHAIYVMPTDGGEPKAVTAHDGLVSGLAWSPDSKKIAASFIGRSTQKGWAMLGEICVIDRDGGETNLLSGALAMGLFWTQDGKHIGFAGTVGEDLSRQTQIWLIDHKGGAPVSRTPRLDLPVGGSVQTNSPAARSPSHFLVNGNDLIVSVTKGGETLPYAISLSGPETAEPIVKGARTARPLALAGSTLLFSNQDCNTPSELGAVDVKSGKEHVVTKFNAGWQSEISWPEVEHLIVKGFKGEDIEGWVLKPRGLKAPYKTVLYIHGGPHAGFGYSFNKDFQELVGAGYAVAFANPHGSTGYGDAFSSSIIGVWGHPELADFNAFLDELVKRGVADADKLGVTGVSGGGHLSGWLIGQTNRFKAAVPEQGVYNMFSMYGTSDAGLALIALEMGGHPHEQGATQRYWDLSPIAHAHKATTPTLLIQGENDIRCPMEQAEQFFTVLKHNGCETEFLRLSNCNHALEMMGPPPLRRVRMDAMKGWFDRHIQ